MDELERRMADAHETHIQRVEEAVLAYTDFVRHVKKDPKYQRAAGEMRSNLLESIDNIRQMDGKAPRGHIISEAERKRLLDLLETAVKEDNVERMRDFAMGKMCGLKPSLRGRTRPEPHIKPRHH
jgi:hypothetical protein